MSCSASSSCISISTNIEKETDNCITVSGKNTIKGDCGKYDLDNKCITVEGFCDMYSYKDECGCDDVPVPEWVVTINGCDKFEDATPNYNGYNYLCDGCQKLQLHVFNYTTEYLVVASGYPITSNISTEFLLIDNQTVNFETQGMVGNTVRATILVAFIEKKSVEIKHKSNGFIEIVQKRPCFAIKKRWFNVIPCSEILFRDIPRLPPLVQRAHLPAGSGAAGPRGAVEGRPPGGQLHPLAGD